MKICTRVSETAKGGLVDGHLHKKNERSTHAQQVKALLATCLVLFLVIFFVSGEYKCLDF